MDFSIEHVPLVSRVTRHVCQFVAVCWLLVGSMASAFAQAMPPQTASPIYWHERIFMIPYRVNPLSKVGNRLDKVELLLSRDGVTNWKSLQQAEPNVQGFRYYAPADGDYWFALRTLDRKGNQLQSGHMQPQLHILVDTQKPVLTMTGILGTGTLDTGSTLGIRQEGNRRVGNRREIVLRYEATDANLRPSSLRVEYQTDSQAWSALMLGEPDVSQPDRLMGQVRLPIADGLKQIKFRASVADRAGLRTRETVEVTLDRFPDTPVEGPLLHAPNSVSDVFNSGRSPIVDPFDRQSALAVQNWPAERSRAAASPVLVETQASGAPTLKNPYLLAQNRGQRENQLQENWTPPLLSESLLSSQGASTSRAAAQVTDSGTQGWTGKLFTPPNANRLADHATRMVNARTFDLEYDLDSVGPWGVARVELWGTHNHGQTWESYGLDPDNRSPMRVSVPVEGLYGFRILVDGANGISSQSPRPGDPPELNVNVDLQPPTAQLHLAEHGQGNLVDHLIIRWAASDSNLEPRPIALFYSAYPNGPWSTIASGLQNTSQYAWRLERHVPEQFYLRLEARDTAGNLTTSQSPMPVTLNRPQPTGRLRSVRPVASQSGAAELGP